MSEGIAPEEDLSYAMDLLEGHDDALEINENYEAILAQAIADVEAWDGEAEQQLLDELWAKIEIMHQTGGSVVGVPVGHIIGAFERYHKHMTAHQVTMAHWSEMKDQLAYLHMSPEEKSAYHKNNLLAEYLDKYGLEYGEDESIDNLMDKVFDDLIAHPERFETYIGEMGTGATFIDQGDYDAYSTWLNMTADSLANPINTVPAEILIFFAGFAPLVGTAMDVLDFVTSLARGDVIGATLNLIPMIGDVVGGLRRVAGRGRRVYSSAKLIEPEIDDVTDKIDELEGVARKIDEQKRNLFDAMPPPRNVPPPGSNFEGEFLEQQRNSLAERGVRLDMNGDAILGTRRGGFDPSNEDDLKIIFKSEGTTIYMYFHELSHLDHYERIGRRAYEYLHRSPRGKLLKEIFVWKQLRARTQDGYGQFLNTDEMRDAAGTLITYRQRVAIFDTQLGLQDTLATYRQFKKDFPEIDLGIDESDIQEAWSLTDELIDKSYINDSLDEAWRKTDD